MASLGGGGALHFEGSAGEGSLWKRPKIIIGIYIVLGWIWETLRESKSI